MTGRDNSQWSRPGAPSRRRGSSASDDVVEQGDGEPPSRPPRIAIILGVAGLVVGLALGYAAGHQHGSNTAAPAAPASFPSPTAQASFTTAAGATSPEDGQPPGGPDSLVQSGAQCATQIGRHLLQLGVQVTNQSATLLILDRVTAEEPLGGLKVISRKWGTCSELHPANAVPGRVMPPEASTWLTVTFRVLVKCPGALPVNFSARFLQQGRHFTTQLPGFVDLGHVPYTGCPVSS
jgi:hypothetical protein